VLLKSCGKGIGHKYNKEHEKSSSWSFRTGRKNNKKRHKLVFQFNNFIQNADG